MQPSTAISGRRGEDFVCARLKERGYRILDRNVRKKFAEIDIVAEQGDTLCFVEVRTRANSLLGHPAETVTTAKQRGIRRAAEAYLAERRIGPRPVRFDVVTILWDTMEVEHFENVF
ncbi:MAG: YraN family protein [Deltaproteobacteria bacterium]|nr:YraN family protein [Deltaproteobacteria bacterium]